MSVIIKTIYNKTPNVKNAKFIGDSFISGDVKIGMNSSIFPNCSIRADLASIIIGDNVNIQENTVIHVSEKENDDYRINPKGHVVIGEGTTIGHGCIIHACQIGKNCIIGMGTIIGDNAIIEDNCLVGAGSNVTPRTVVKQKELWFGNPAKYMRDLRDSDLEYIKKNCEIYLQLSEEYTK